MAVNRNSRHGFAAKRERRTARSAGAAASEQPLVAEIYDQIMLRIIRGQIVGGQPLKSTVLAKELKVSRTPVVQALQRLAADGIVSLEPNKRAVVREGAEDWLLGVHQLRELLEPTAVALAAQRIPDDELERLKALADAVGSRRQPGWAEAVRKFDFALHLAIADHTDNLPLREAIRKCWSYKRLSYAAGEDSLDTLAKAYEQHLAILNALIDRDSATASAAMLFHLRSAAQARREAKIV